MEAMEYQEALEICEELIGQHPHHLADLLKIKGDLLIKNGSYEEAQRFFHEISLLGKFPWALLGQEGSITFRNDMKRPKRYIGN